MQSGIHLHIDKKQNSNTGMQQTFSEEEFPSFSPKALSSLVISFTCEYILAAVESAIHSENGHFICAHNNSSQTYTHDFPPLSLQQPQSAEPLQELHRYHVVATKRKLSHLNCDLSKKSHLLGSNIVNITAVASQIKLNS